MLAAEKYDLSCPFKHILYNFQKKNIFKNTPKNIAVFAVSLCDSPKEIVSVPASFQSIPYSMVQIVESSSTKNH